MLYLFTQMWLWIIVSFILGWVANWYFCCRQSSEESVSTARPSAPQTVPNEPVSAPVTATSEVKKEEEKSAIDDTWKPQGFASTPEDSDDLKRIKGIGAVNERALNGLGIYKFSQIAQWNADNIKWVEGFLAFPGRIGREDWVTQAKTLAEKG